MGGILENLLVMVLSVVVLLGGFYLLLVLLNVWMKFKSGSREQDGLTDLFIEAQREIHESPPNQAIETDASGLEQDHPESHGKQ